LSRDLQLNCVISFFFHLHLVLYACAARFDVYKLFGLHGQLNSPLVYLWPFRVPTARSSLIAAACIASRPNSRARGIRGGRRGAGAGAGAGAGSHGDSELTGVPAPPRACELPIRQERERERAEITGAPPRRGNTNSIAARNVFFSLLLRNCSPRLARPRYMQHKEIHGADRFPLFFPPSVSFCVFHLLSYYWRCVRVV
jgi:hypothetical protein